MKLAIFDLDGVLVNTHKIHTTALRSAVKQFAPIAFKLDYLDASDGVRTIEKLHRLQMEFQLEENEVYAISKMKKRLTLIGLHYISHNQNMVNVISTLKQHGVSVAVASNSRREFVDKILSQIGVRELVDFVVCGDEVKQPKPNPEIFLTAAKHFNCQPEDAIVFEDSSIGVEAAIAAGMRYVVVDPTLLVSVDQIRKVLRG